MLNAKLALRLSTRLLSLLRFRSRKSLLNLEPWPFNAALSRALSESRLASAARVPRCVSALLVCDDFCFKAAS